MTAVKERLTTETFNKFLEDFNNGKFPSQRLGQAAINHFGLTGQSYLWYDQDKRRCIAYIRELLIDYQA